MVDAARCFGGPILLVLTRKYRQALQLHRATKPIKRGPYSQVFNLKDGTSQAILPSRYEDYYWFPEGELVGRELGNGFGPVDARASSASCPASSTRFARSPGT